MTDINVERLRTQLKAALAELPPEQLPEGLGDVIVAVRSLLPLVPGAPWFVSPVEDDDGAGEYITVGPHEAPHYEEMIAQFMLGNHTDASVNVVVLVMNNLEALLEAAQRGLEK